MSLIVKDPAQEQRKFEELVVYVALRSASDLKCGSTKLNKILFYAEFVHYARTGQSITGAEYQRLAWGPAARPLLPAIARLKADGSVSEALTDYGGFTQRRVVACREPDLSMFTAEEISAVDRVIAELLPYNASEVSELSHRFSGWRLAETGETIPYHAVFMPAKPQELSEEEISFGQAVAARINAACVGPS